MVFLFKLRDGDPVPLVGVDAFAYDHETVSVEGERRIGRFVPTAFGFRSRGLLAVDIPMSELDLVTDESTGVPAYRLISGDLNTGLKVSFPADLVSK